LHRYRYSRRHTAVDIHSVIGVRPWTHAVSQHRNVSTQPSTVTRHELSQPSAHSHGHAFIKTAVDTHSSTQPSCTQPSTRTHSRRHTAVDAPPSTRSRRHTDTQPSSARSRRKATVDIQPSLMTIVDDCVIDKAITACDRQSHNTVIATLRRKFTISTQPPKQSHSAP
jgi:hypothetical protein